MTDPTHAETQRALDVALYALTLSAKDAAPRMLEVASRRLAAARPAPSTPAADEPSTVTAATEPTERGDLAKHVGAKIRAAREQAHMTQAQVAERLDCTPTAVSYWESGARHLPPEMVSRMAAALGVTAPDLLPTAWFADWIDAQPDLSELAEKIVAYDAVPLLGESPNLAVDEWHEIVDAAMHGIVVAVRRLLSEGRE